MFTLRRSTAWPRFAIAWLVLDAVLNTQFPDDGHVLGELLVSNADH